MRATVWIFDLTHRSRRIECDVPSGVRALAAAEQATEQALGVELGVPLGLRALNTDPELLFLLPRAGEGAGWLPLRELASADPRGFALYVEAMLGGWSPPSHDLDVFHFGNTPELAANLAHLVVKGVKRGTTGWTEAAEREGSAIPHAGMVSIVTDGYGYALCAIRTERVEHVRFGNIDAAHAWVEGEGDRTLDDWREGHLRFFHAEAAQLGLAFSEDAMVFFEHFRVLSVFGRADP